MKRFAHILERTVVIGVCALSLFALVFTFELRYIWYVGHTDYLILRTGLAVCAIGIVVLWVFRPTRLGISLIALALLFYPQLVLSLRISLNLGFVAFAFLVVVLLVAATELRRRYWPRDEVRAA